MFNLDKTGKLTVLFTFTGGADGSLPGDLIRDSTGNLYGTTYAGGDPNCQAPYGCGRVFKLGKTGKETVLHIFTGGGDGASPGDLFRDADGNLYGTTDIGGDPSCPYGGSAPGCGTVFKLQP